MVSSIPEFLCHQMNIVFHFFLAISFITQISEANQLFWHHDIDNLFQNFLGQLDRTTQVCKVKGFLLSSGFLLTSGLLLTSGNVGDKSIGCLFVATIAATLMLARDVGDSLSW